LRWLARKRDAPGPPPPKDPHTFATVVRTALTTRVAGQGRPGRVLAVLGLVLAAATFGLVGSLGIVICLCLAL
ncbi:MFS transporter, partial [Stenotrophomonas maltophilia]